MILVTGATGTIGSEVLRLLAARGQAVRAMTRNPAQVTTTSGVEVVRADFDDYASLQEAVTEVQSVFLLTAPETPTPRHDLALLRAARAAGVARVVKLSAIGTGEKAGNDETVGAWHLDAERAVRASGMAWTLLRPSVFASNALGWAAAVKAGEPIPNMTGSGRQGVIDPRDVAAVAAETLLSDVAAGRTHTLTGPDLLDVPDQAACLEQVLRYPVKTVEVPLDTARKQMLGRGMDDSMVDAVITAFAWVRAGHSAVVTGDVAQILGRPPASFRTWADDHRDAFITG
ncbi:MAG TPA: NAD(P)H-binding protein [Streptosporangiaceae bacterium]